jgi:FkbM family methyltransferase
MSLLPLKRMTAHVLCHPTLGKLIRAWTGDNVSVQGCVINTKHAQVSSQLVAQLFWGLYERAERRFVQQYLRRDLDVIELGSGMGVVSSLIAKIQNHERRLLCVEANSFLLEAIQYNISRNAPWKKFEVLNRAIDYTNQSSSAFVLDNVVNSRLEKDSTDAASLQVPVETLNSMWRKSGFQEYVLVSDIEGAEAGYIFQDAVTLVPCRQIIAELHETIFTGHRYSVDYLREQLEKTHGFQMKASHGPVFVFEKD